MVSSETFHMQPTAPLNFDLTAHIFSNGDRQVRTYHDGIFQQVIRTNGKLVLFRVTSNRTVDKPELTVELQSNNALTQQDRQAVQQIITAIFSLNLDLKAFYDEVENDQTMHQITKQLYGFKLPTTPTIFESLLNSIVEQQISIKIARTIEERLAKKFGDHLEINGETYYAFPTPNNLTVSVSEIQGCGLSQRKSQYIQNAAQLIIEGKLDLQRLQNESTEQIIVELDRIKGVGVWTAELTILRGMHRLDVLPADDFGIRRVISKYYCNGEPIKAAEAREIAKAWGTWKGLAAFYLLLAEAKGINV
ncbi:MAG: DNA-3-methyladenine glycosylase [Candidatus Bathyarchaeota archaeon]|nr:DNA-3-methyladenine glycosylase [Candidatus Bathyarchaeota archaeon]